MSTGWIGHQVRTEGLKLSTVRAPWALLVMTVALTAALALRPALDAGRHGNPSIGTAGAALAVLGSVRWTPVLALVLGVLVITSEWRHGTITDTVLQTPDRVRLLAGKVSTGLAFGAMLGIASCAVALTVGAASRAVTWELLNPDVVARSLGLLTAAPAYALIGVGIGALLPRLQSVAVTGPVLWVAFAESLVVGSIDRHLRPWSFTGVTSALEHAGDVGGVLSPWWGAVGVFGLAGLLVTAGAVRIGRMDLS